jgi:4-hydroxy-3-polyprenylbenzoate decarboxylase
MVRAKEIWQELGLPKLADTGAWFGYELGDWSDQDRQEAELALQGKHYEVGEIAAKKRVPI